MTPDDCAVTALKSVVLPTLGKPTNPARSMLANNSSCVRNQHFNMTSLGCPARTPNCVSQKQEAGRATRPASHEHDEPRKLTIYFLHCDRDGGIFPGGAAVRHPVAGFRVTHQFVRGSVSLRFEFTDDILGRGDLVGAIHEVDRNCCYGLRLVIKDLHGLGIVENIEVLIVTLVARAT